MSSNYNTKNSKDVPVILPDASIDGWLEDLDIWRAATDLEQRKIVPYIITVGLAQSPAHHRSGKQLWRKNKDKYQDFTTTGTGEAAVTIQYNTTDPGG